VLKPDDGCKGIPLRISYGMPEFFYQGPVVFFAAFEDHLGF
jgi:hypothetical protein